MSELERILRSIETKASHGRAIALSLTSETTIQELHQEDMLLCISALWSTFEDIEQLMGSVYGPLGELSQTPESSQGSYMDQRSPAVEGKFPALAMLVRDYTVAITPFWDLAEKEILLQNDTDFDGLGFLITAARAQHREFADKAFDLYGDDAEVPV